MNPYYGYQLYQAQRDQTRAEITYGDVGARRQELGLSSWIDPHRAHLAWCSRTWPQGKVGRFVRSRSDAVESAVLMIGVGNQGF